MSWTTWGAGRAWWRAARRAALLAPWALLAVSCTRMPTAPRYPVTVKGVVTGPGGEPIPGSLVAFRPGEPDLHDFDSAITDARGAYSVVLHSGTYWAEVEAPNRGFLAHNDRISVSVRHARVDFAFSGFRITGKVLDPSGVPLDSGWVTARLPDFRSASIRLRQGSYSLLVPGGTYGLSAGPLDYWSGLPFTTWDSVAIAGDTTIDLRLDGIQVSGTVLGPDGAPMAGVRVEPYARGSQGASRSQTGLDGGYRLYLPSGSYTFHFGPPYPFYIIPRIVGPQTIEAPVSIDCDLSGVEWTGTIRRSDTNQPVSGLIVLVELLDDPDERAVISNGTQGEFRFVVEPNRRYDLKAYDSAVNVEVASLHGITATVDTTFELLVPPPGAAPAGGEALDR